MKLNRKQLRKLIMEALNENESPNKNIAIGDALYKHFREKIKDKEELLNSNGFGFRQNANIDKFGFENILDSKGKKEFSNALEGQNITYVFGFLKPGIVSQMTGGKFSAYKRKELMKWLQNEVNNIGNQYGINIKIGHTSANTRYTGGADAVVYTINRID